MNSETVLRALGSARTEYLDHAMEHGQAGGRRLSRPLRMVLLTAAVLVLTITCAYAGHSVWSMSQRQVKQGLFASYELFFEANPATPDAPDTLEQYYLPRELPEGFRLDYARLSYGDAFAAVNEVRWVRGEFGTAGKMSFTQRPLKSLLEDDAFAQFNYRPRNRGEVEIGGVDYMTVTEFEATHNITAYYWVDENRHYVFRMGFTDEIPQPMREAILQSVDVVDKAACAAALGADEYDGCVYVAQTGTEGYENISVMLENSGGRLQALSQWRCGDRGFVLSVGAYAGIPQGAEDEIEETNFTVDGTDVVCTKSAFVSNGLPCRQENWFFTAPDGVTELWLSFSSTDGGYLSWEQKLAIFRGIAPVTPADLIQ
ncbi:MAG: hypothetical protein II458_01960 [Oscillospiraceae bacterium]|nr:hypothetical protein [Oscillospiraceae bacterium]